MPRTKQPEVLDAPSQNGATEKTASAREQTRAQKAELEAQGFRRCPSHTKLWDQLPDEVKKPVAGHKDDPSIRPLSEFPWQIASCKECARIRSKLSRKNRGSGGTTSGGTARKSKKSLIPIDSVKLPRHFVAGTTPVGKTENPNLYPFAASLNLMANDVQSLVQSGEASDIYDAIEQAVAEITKLVEEDLRAELAARVEGPDAKDVGGENDLEGADPEADADEDEESDEDESESDEVEDESEDEEPAAE
jgi:hypothetical protein